MLNSVFLKNMYNSIVELEKNNKFFTITLYKYSKCYLKKKIHLLFLNITYIVIHIVTIGHLDF